MEESDYTIPVYDEVSFDSGLNYDEELVSNDLDENNSENDLDSSGNGFVDEIELICEEEELSGPKITLTDSTYISLMEVPCTIVPEGSKEAKLALHEFSMAYLRCAFEGPSCKMDTKATQLSCPRVISFGTSYSLNPTEDASTLVSPHMIYDSMEDADLKETEATENTEWWNSHVFVQMSRLLHSNTSPPFWKLEDTIESDPMDLGLSFTYTPVEIFDLTDFRSEGFRVTCIHQVRRGMLIVGLSSTTKMRGGVALWNAKNLGEAERFYTFSHPVTVAKMSDSSPNLMAVGFSNGQITLVDVSSRALKIVYENASLGPALISDVHWWKVDENSAENLVVALGNFVYRISRPFHAPEVRCLIQTTYLKQSELGLRKTLHTISLTVGPAVQSVLCPVGYKGYYMIGDAEGFLRLCNVHSSNEYFDIINAHTGVINTMKVSPHDQKMFLTCGSDGKARIWYFHIHDPLLTLDSAFQCADLRDITWSPIHATIIAGVTNEHILVWDIRRKFHEPVTILPVKRPPTWIQFSADGRVMLIGSDGGAQVFGFKRMPFPELNKSASVVQSISWWLKNENKLELFREFRAKVNQDRQVY